MNNKDIKKVWKYKLAITDKQEVMVPTNSIPLSVIEQNGEPVLYVLVNPYYTRKETWTIHIRGTGHPVEEEMLRSSHFMGTVSTAYGALIWHIWIERFNNETP